MNDMPKHTRLMKRGNVFYHRASIPEDIRATYGKTEETFSLKTRDPREALRLVRIGAARVDALFQAHRDEIARLNGPLLEELTVEQVKTIADVYFANILAEDESERLKGFSDEDFDLYASDVEFVEATARDAYRRGHVPTFVPAVFGEITKALNVNWRLREGSSSWPVLSRALLEATIKASAAKKQRQVGDIVDTPAVDVRSLKGNARTGQTITGLFEAWKRDHEADGGSAKTVAMNRQQIQAFIAYLGHDEAERVTAFDVASFCDHLRHERQLTAKTVSGKYLACIRTLYRRGISKALVTVDPTAVTKVKVPKKIIEREQGFTDAEAKRILSCALAAPSASGRTEPHTRRAFRWVPWICAYTGARGGEITQLRKGDVTTEHGIPCIRITPEGGSVKNREYRIVPLHPHLIQQGFLEMVKAQPPGPLFYLENSRTKSNGHKTSASMRGTVGKWVKQSAKIDPRTQPNHGWRHRVKTIARDVDIPREYIDRIQGHKDGTASTGYGEATMKALYREICKLPRYDVTEAGD
ncbi:MAG: tyrosine-type recombinase/integrase [Rhizobium sp.]|nr:tyrosine-type recombinase/integrase [Rhizobium sp.]